MPDESASVYCEFVLINLPYDLNIFLRRFYDTEIVKIIAKLPSTYCFSPYSGKSPPFLIKLFPEKKGW